MKPNRVTNKQAESSLPKIDADPELFVMGEFWGVASGNGACQVEQAIRRPLKSKKWEGINVT